MKCSVGSLAYLEIEASDVDAWRHYAEQVIGASCEESAGNLLIRIDDDAWRVRVISGGSDDVVCIGFSVDSAAELEGVHQQLESVGTNLEEATEEEAGSRGVEHLYVCHDPDGLRVELYTGSRASANSFSSPIGVSGFVTDGQGLGHIVIAASDQEKAEDFYMRGLGFLLSDHIMVGPEGRQLQLTFLHCNPRHHTLAMVPIKAPKRLNHIMFQVMEMDEVGSCLDRARDAGCKISSSLGRHPNDQMFSFYMQTPSGFDIEYGYGGIEIDDATWQTDTYYQTSTWGHRPE